MTNTHNRRGRWFRWDTTVDPERIECARKIMDQGREEYRQWHEKRRIEEDRQRKHEASMRAIDEALEIYLRQEEQRKRLLSSQDTTTTPPPPEPLPTKTKKTSIERMTSRQSRLAILRKNKVRPGRTKDLIRLIDRAGKLGKGDDTVVDFSVVPDEVKIAFYRRRQTANSRQTLPEVLGLEKWKPTKYSKTFVVS